MNYINLTPHRLNICGTDGRIAILEPSGAVARVEVSITGSDVTEIGGIEIKCVSHRRGGHVIGLPDEVWQTYLIVSGMVREALPERMDLFSPAELIRDSAGQPIGCNGLVTNICLSREAKAQRWHERTAEDH